MSQQKEESQEDCAHNDLILTNCQYCDGTLTKTNEILYVKVYKKKQLKAPKINELNIATFDLSCETCNYYILIGSIFFKIKLREIDPAHYTKIMIGKQAAVRWTNFNDGYSIIFKNKIWKVNDSVKSINDLKKIFKKIDTSLLLL